MTQGRGEMETLTISTVASPLGDISLVSDGSGRLLSCEYADLNERLARLLDRRLGTAGYQLQPGPAPVAVAAAIDRYFSGDLAAIDAVPVLFKGTDFQEAVWAALRQIPAGTPESYGQLAVRLGRANAARAVGHANHNNPMEIVVPCHRVIGQSGALTGYAGGLDRKRWLLAHEAKFASGDLESLMARRDG